MRAERAAASDQAFLLDDAQRFETDRRGERIAAEGRAVRARREYVHHLAGTEEGGDRQHAAAERLADHQPVRAHALVLAREPGAGAAETRLDLVEDEQHMMRIAQASYAGEPSRRWHHDAGLALDRLDQNGRGLGLHGPLHGGEIAEWHAAESGRERSEAVTIIRFARERDDGRGAAVKISVRHDDLGT